MTAVAAYPAEIAPLVDELLASVRDVLGDNLVGVYLCGSLATGAFDPQTSDVDVLVVTERHVTDGQFASLRGLHERIPLEGNEFGYPYEVYYIDRETLRRFRPGRRHVKAGIGEVFGWKEHRHNWVIERWAVREHGIVVSGPDPKTLIGPIRDNEIPEAARAELLSRVDDWAHEWNDGVDPAPWIEKLGAQAFEVITVCRALRTVERGGLPSKSEAVQWALDNLPDEWLSLVRWAHEHRDDRNRNTDMVPEVIRFVHWAAAEVA